MTSPTITTVDPLALTLPTSHIIPLWIYCFIIILLSLVGNSTVLYSSLRYNTIKLDQISVLLVRNLAAADLIYTVLIVLPILVTYSAGGWVLGEGWCWAMSQLTFIPGTVNTLTVLAITLYRLKILVSPFSHISLTSGKLLVGLIWLTSLLGTILSLSYGSASNFSPTAARCNSSFYRDPAGGLVFLVVATGLLIILPVFTITLGNIAIGIIALKRSTSANRSKGIATVTALSGLFILSWTPLVIFTFFRIRKIAVPSFLDLLAFHCIFLNTAGNPVLYTMTNRRFGEYVRSCVARFLCCGGRRGGQVGDAQRGMGLKPPLAASSKTSAPTASTALTASSC